MQVSSLHSWAHFPQKNKTTSTAKTAFHVCQGCENVFTPIAALSDGLPQSSVGVQGK